MKLETKHDVGDVVYWLKNNKVVSESIEKIEIVVSTDIYFNIKVDEFYYFQNVGGSIRPTEFYGSKEELLQSL